MADFPPEIKEQIASFCTLSTALSLAVTHSTYLEASERRIYHSLTILADTQSVQALTALSRKRARYSFVQSLTVEIFDNNDEANVKVGRMVVEVLHSLVNLEELRIRLGPWAYGRNARDVEGAVVLLRDLDRVLSSKDMPQLKTLFCNDSFDLADILKSQRRLENLVFRSSTNVIVDQAAVVETLERLRDAGEMPRTLRAIYGVHEPACDGQFATGAIQRGPTPNWNIVLLPIFFPDLDNLFERLSALLGTEKPCKGRMCLDSVGIAQVFCRDLSQIDELLRKLGNSFQSVVHLGIVTEGPDPTVSVLQLIRYSAVTLPTPA
ncbi:hypothetical protein CC1G_05432 [Coprinopsis cinerea okayama7|uniref:Uncharacterized protein n=1 Tax=Coprinopsis cinerea (strain Okayama-7 / 130 / ATCC MYA-4618 / FGSC 9003) TaxID=240176 RepID=A8NQ33_COPC7|nr:hypothetical protein CC1G_05432 [Coprinopsis cinerea okayama7\|eukprot:XP_001835470.2 hypothetical protein CC1G_05432 [Coprinopsis cinerea okayama7\